jgi:hypothetical protein
MRRYGWQTAAFRLRLHNRPDHFGRKAVSSYPAGLVDGAEQRACFDVGTKRPAVDRLLPARFLAAAVAYYARLGITIRRTLTDNGPCYHSRAFARFCQQIEIKRRYTRPYTPRTNGKAERFIQTAIREWAYARAYLSSSIRAAELSTWIHLYNWHRPHASLGNAPPISRSGLDRNNLLRQHISQFPTRTPSRRTPFRRRRPAARSGLGSP